MIGRPSTENHEAKVRSWLSRRARLHVDFAEVRVLYYTCCDPTGKENKGRCAFARGPAVAYRIQGSPTFPRTKAYMYRTSTS